MIASRLARQRSRVGYLAAALATIAAGLASRHPAIGLRDRFGPYPGDVLWALMVFVGLGVFLRRASSVRLAACAMAFAFTIELLKLCQLPWLVAVRQTTPGHLVFGHVFSWQNLVAYTIGIGVGLVLEVTLTRPPGPPIVNTRRTGNAPPP